MSKIKRKKKRWRERRERERRKSNVISYRYKEEFDFEFVSFSCFRSAHSPSQEELYTGDGAGQKQYFRRYGNSSRPCCIYIVRLRPLALGSSETLKARASVSVHLARLVLNDLPICSHQCLRVVKNRGCCCLSLQ